MECLINNNEFSIEYYSRILDEAIKQGYKFVTLREFFDLGFPSTGHFILRHDLDTKPQTMKKMLDAEFSRGVRSTIFARVTANDYNLLSYPVVRMLSDAESQGFEIGLHTSCVEYAKINGMDPLDIIRLEKTIMSNYFDISGIAPHRDLNYSYNSLPFIESVWDNIESMGFKYQAYDERIESASIYVNEGFNPHLCWRSKKPEDVIKSNGTIYMLTHNHWWYDVHPFEEWK
jgi:hypothetical protein